MKETTLHFSNICMKCNSPLELPGTECNSFAKFIYFFFLFFLFQAHKALASYNFHIHLTQVSSCKDSSLSITKWD